MAKKTIYCKHEPHTKVYHRSKSSKLVCCNECYLMEISKVLVESQGEEFVLFLDMVKSLDFSKALGG